jgi:hypothetical protein
MKLGEGRPKVAPLLWIAACQAEPLGISEKQIKTPIRLYGSEWPDLARNLQVLSLATLELVRPLLVRQRTDH